jgi:DNA adenine methylase
VHRESRSAVRHPAFPWFGGKWLLAPWIIDRLPDCRVYAEPFGGAASVLLRKPPSPVEIYNDLDGELSNFFRVCREQFFELVRRIALSPWHRGDYMVERQRVQDEAPADDLERARRFLMVAGQSFSGCFGQSWSFTRSGSSRGMAETCSRWLNIPATMYSVADRLATVQVECLPAKRLIRLYDARDVLFYCDPPYHPETRSGGEYRRELTADDHGELLDLLCSCKARVALSGYRFPLYDRVLRRWKRYTRRVTCFAEKGRAGKRRSHRVECLWIKPRR